MILSRIYNYLKGKETNFHFKRSEIVLSVYPPEWLVWRFEGYGKDTQDVAWELWFLCFHVIRYKNERN